MQELDDFGFLKNKAQELEMCLKSIWQQSLEAVSIRNQRQGRSNTMLGRIPRDPIEDQKAGIGRLQVEFDNLLDEMYFVVQDTKYNIDQEYLQSKEKFDSNINSSSISGTENPPNLKQELLIPGQLARIEQLRMALGNLNPEEIASTQKGHDEFMILRPAGTVNNPQNWIYIPEKSINFSCVKRTKTI
ncbi:hypothetical protein G9A89_020739 [Geosiphon pyriformis]|nr:hypothetical protein G9A89_020739 [Geosiphon pyriformis]